MHAYFVLGHKIGNFHFLCVEAVIFHREHNPNFNFAPKGNRVSHYEIRLTTSLQEHNYWRDLWPPLFEMAVSHASSHENSACIYLVLHIRATCPANLSHNPSLHYAPAGWRMCWHTFRRRWWGTDRAGPGRMCPAAPAGTCKTERLTGTVRLGASKFTKARHWDSS
jgi:hypothetical protein